MRGQLIPLTIVALFVLGTLASAAPATQTQIDAAEGALDNQGPKGDDVLQGTWDEKQERHRWYYRDGGSLNYAREGRTGNCCGSYAIIWEPITDNALGNDGVTFPWGTVTNDFELTRIVSSLNIAAGGDSDVVVQLFDGATPIAGASTTHVFTGLVGAEVPIPGYGSLALGNPRQTAISDFSPAVTIKEGTDLNVRVYVPNPVLTDVLPTEINYGDGAADGYVELYGNTARVNAWTTDNDGVVTTEFPTAQDAPSEDRHIRTWVAHVNALGSDHTPGRIPLDANQHGTGVRILDKDGNDRTGISDIRVNTRTVKATSPGMHLVEYDIQYPDDLLDEDGNIYDGELIIELFGQGQQWKERLPVAIGGAQVELDLAEFEDATKTVLVGEETTFLMTLRNGGLVRDDVIITGNEVNGWGVDALVDSVNLGPGEQRTFPVTITPPANAVSGDFQAFEISAISSRTGRTDSETITVILTNIESDGVDLLATQLDTVKISAGQTKSIGLTVKNTGNSGEDFTVSTAGAPLGWKAKVNPSSMELGAKSQTGVLLTMTAPADAKQGDAFGLTVTVRSVVDNTIKDVMLIPYEVFFREDFTLEVSHDTVGGVFQNHITTLADMQAFGDSAGSLTPAPGIHTLRDEGPDAEIRSSCSGLDLVGLFCTSSSAWDGNNDPDTDYDQSTLYRLVLTNHGDREDTIRLTPGWVFDSAWESKDGAECEERDGGNNDLVPDGWRFRYWEANTPEPAGLDPVVASMGGTNHHDEKSTGGLGSKRLSADVKTVDLEAGEVKVVWVELGWRSVSRLDDNDNQNTDSLGDSACYESNTQSGGGSREVSTNNGDTYADATKNAVVKFTAESLRDLTKVQELFVRAHYEPNGGQTRDGSNRYSDQRNGVELGIDPIDYTNPDRIGFDNVFLAEGSADQRTAAYHLRLVNSGNEMDTIRVEIPLDTSDFEYFIPTGSIDDRQAYQNAVDHNSGSPRPAGCTDPSGKTFMDCTLGAFDEISFQVHARGKEGQNPIGQLHAFQVRAISMDSLEKAGGAETSLLTLNALATGTHAFAISKPVVANGIHDVDVVAGQSIKVPFTLSNVGTSFDNYQVDLLETPPEETGWDGIYSFNSPQFLAAGKDHNGFLTIYAPSDASVGDSETFRIRVASLDGTNVPDRTLRIQANVIAAAANIELVPDPIEVVGFPGGTVDMTFKATRTGGLASSVDFALDELSLPDGWSVVGDATPAAVDYDVNGVAEYTFTIDIDDDAVGSSRVPVTVTGKDSNNNVATAQGVISLDSAAIGVHLSAPDDFDAEEIHTNVVAGSNVQVQVRVQNLGGGIDQIALDTETLPEGWTVSYSEGNPDASTFQPFEARVVTLTIGAPEGVAPGAGIDVVLKATSLADATQTDSLVIAVRTGQSILEVGTPAGPTRYLAPLESTTFSYAVLNNGTVRDEITFGAGLSAAYEDLVDITFSPPSAILGPGESETVTAKLTVPEGFLPESVIPIKLQALSDGPLLNAFGESSVEVRVLDHRTTDIDNDGNPEYAVDRDRDLSNGFEEFGDPKPDGKASVSLDMAGFLTTDAKDEWTVLVTDNGTTFEVFTFLFDLTGDGRIDHFVDEDQDNLPDTFWDPQTNGRDNLDVTFDVTGDGVREYFVDVNGDQLLDVWYDITTGKVGVLLKVDVDGDDVVDFVVDLDGDGAHDDNEPVLFGKDGKITKITQSIDVNGDGKLDLVVDEDGDGIPDYFVPFGKTRGVKIVLEDVTGDGVEDWTYDANNDGRRDSYYDPVTGKTGSIDTGSEFIDGLAQYWYVPTLFALVTVLFVVLVVVTRR